MSPCNPNQRPKPPPSLPGPPVLGNDCHPAFRLFISHLTDTICNGLSQCRPWSMLIDRSAFSKLETTSEASLQIHRHCSYFRMDYLAYFAVVLGVSLLTNPFALIFLLGLHFAATSNCGRLHR